MESPREEDRFPLLCAGGWGSRNKSQGYMPGGGNATGRIDQCIKWTAACLIKPAIFLRNEHAFTALPFPNTALLTGTPCIWHISTTSLYSFIVILRYRSTISPSLPPMVEGATVAFSGATLFRCFFSFSFRFCCFFERLFFICNEDTYRF